MKSLKVMAGLGASLLALAIAAPSFAQAPAGAPPAAAGGRGGGAPANPPADLSWRNTTYKTAEEHYNALKAKANGGQKKTYATLPDWSGVWTNGGNAPGVGRVGFVLQNGVGIARPPANGQPVTQEAPVLTPKYQDMLNKELDRVSRGIEWDYLSFCLPAGFPRFWTEPFLREFIVTPNETWIVNEQQSEVIRVYTDGRGHTPEDEAYPLFDGDSIGFWDGDTLVVWTNQNRPGEWNRSAPEYSDKIETVMEIKKINDSIIEVRLTAYDPESLQKPWHITFRSQKVPDQMTRINMWSCNENTNVVQDASGATNFILPGEKGYKKPGEFQSSSHAEDDVKADTAKKAPAKKATAKKVASK